MNTSLLSVIYPPDSEAPSADELQAAINAVHCRAGRFEDTDWAQIVKLDDQLLAVAWSPVAALNRAVALAEVAGPAAALAVVDDLELDRYQPFHAARHRSLSEPADTP